MRPGSLLRSGFPLGVVLLFGTLSGCSTLDAPTGQESFNDDVPYSKEHYLEDHKKYDEALNQGNIEDAKRLRDHMLDRTITNIDRAYIKFRSQFDQGKEVTSTLLDVAKLGLSAASITLGQSKALSQAVSTVDRSNRLMNKNFFRGKTAEVLFATMDGLRDGHKARIQKKRMLLPADYGFDAAFDDASLLFNTATVMNALQKLPTDAEQSPTAISDTNPSLPFKPEIIMTVIQELAADVGHSPAVVSDKNDGLSFNAGTVMTVLQKLATDPEQPPTVAMAESNDARERRLDEIFSLLPMVDELLKQKEKLNAIVTNLTSDESDQTKLSTIKQVLAKQNIAFTDADPSSDLHRKLAAVLQDAQDDEATAKQLMTAFKDVGIWGE